MGHRDPKVCAHNPSDAKPVTDGFFEKDVDLIAINSRRPEDIKQILVSAAPREFFLVPSKNKRKRYKVLWYRPGPRSRWQCKVDILVPGKLSVPRLKEEDIVRLPGRRDLPLVPFITLTLLKLRGWCDHVDDERRYMREKAPVDQEDLNELLDIARRDGITLPESNRSYLPWQLKKKGQERVLRYIRSVPSSMWKWRAIGFSVGEVVDDSDSD